MSLISCLRPSRMALAVILAACTSASNSWAQSVVINPNTQHQTITGFGGMNGVGWISDLTDAQVRTAFGSEPGQLGLSLMRVRIDPNSANWQQQVPSAVRARALGAKILATPWSPPAHMKTNNSLINGGKLKPEFYGAYATHLLDFKAFMASKGAPLDALSIQNEPDWHPDYESCDWSGQDFVNFLNAQGSRFGSDIKVAVGEAVGFHKRFTDPVLNSPSAASHVEIIAGHLYGAVPQDYPLARAKGKEVWMTEHYTDSKNDADLWPMALDVGTELHRSMSANFNAYIWWYIRRAYGLIKENSEVSKRGHIMAQYARFVRPGFQRIGATEFPYNDVAVTAYKGPNNKLVMVVVNTSTLSRRLDVSLPQSQVGNWVKYSTSRSLNVGFGGRTAIVNGAASMYVEPQSVTTFESEAPVTPVSSAATKSSQAASSVRSSAAASSVAPPTTSSNCTYEVTGDWGTGFTAALRIKNTGTRPINGWQVSLRYTDNARVNHAWNTTLSGTNPYSLSDAGWNATINPGQVVELGLQGSKPAGVALHPSISGGVCQ